MKFTLTMLTFSSHGRLTSNIGLAARTIIPPSVKKGKTHKKLRVRLSRFLTAKIAAEYRQLGKDTTNAHWLKMATRLKRVNW